MSSVQTFYLLNNVLATVPTKPASFLGTMNQNSGLSGNSARFMAAFPDQLQSQSTGVWASIPASTTHSLGMVQYLSSPLFGQSQVAAANWTIALALKLTNAAASFVWSGNINLYLVKSDGTVRTAILENHGVGSASRTNTDERTCYKTNAAGAAFTPQADDYLCLEVFMNVNNSGAGGVTPQAYEYSHGATAISSDAVAVSDAKARIVSPSTLYVKSEGPPSKIDIPLPPTPRGSSIVLAKTDLLTPREPGVKPSRLGFHEGLQRPGG